MLLTETGQQGEGDGYREDPEKQTVVDPAAVRMKSGVNGMDVKGSLTVFSLLNYTFQFNLKSELWCIRLSNCLPQMLKC